MAFFTKLKDRLFKSSSKLEEGLDAIVEDGGSAEQVSKGDQVSPDSGPGADVPDPAPDEIPPAQVQEITPDVKEFPNPAPQEAPPSDIPDELPENPADTPSKDLAPDAPIDAPPDTATKEQGGNPASALAADDTDQPLKDLPATALPSPGPEGVPASPPDIAATIADAVASGTDHAKDSSSDAPAPPREGGLLGRLFNRSAPPSAPIVRRVLDDDMLEQLEELLIASDMGVDTALRVAANMADGRMGKRLSTNEIKDLLAKEITRIMSPVAKPLPLFPKKPQVVLVVGVNGSGKTTTIGKLASQFKAAGKSVVIAAGDTFRAAAVEQLEIWGQRAGVPVLKAAEGSDPAALAFDALQKAEADNADLLMIDTAGRLQNRADLMEELAKIIRVIRKKDPTAPHNTLLVLDATTGQNALSQVETFRKMADVSGLVMTKLDGTAKGGVLVALADKFGLPIHAIGVGEQIDDLAPFDPEDFARALTGADS